MGCVAGAAAGWISFGPREDHTKLALARITKPVNEREVWFLLCACVARQYRGKGVQHRGGVPLAHPSRHEGPARALVNAIMSSRKAVSSGLHRELLLFSRRFDCWSSGGAPPCPARRCRRR
jgi:hypothetical protein